MIAVHVTTTHAVLRIVCPPVGYRDRACPSCGGRLAGCIRETADAGILTADEADPDVCCPACHYCESEPVVVAA